MIHLSFNQSTDCDCRDRELAVGLTVWLADRLADSGPR